MNEVTTIHIAKEPQVWATVLTSLFAIYPPTANLSAQYPSLSLIIVSLIFFLLRTLSHGKLSFASQNS